MKNKKGFTLTELLAVILILSILVIIAVPNVWNALKSSKDALTSYEKKAIEDAAKQVVTEVISCELTNETYNVLELDQQTSPTCSDIQKYMFGKQIDTTVDLLKENKYFEDVSNHCSGTVKITTENNYKVKVDTSDVTCKK